MIHTITCIATNLFRTYLIYRYIAIFSEKAAPGSNFKKYTRGLAFALFFLVNTGSYLAFHSAWINFLVNLAGVGLLTFLYHKSVKISLFTGCSIYLVNMACDTLAVLPFVTYTYGQEFNQFYEVISVFLFFICELATEKIIIRQRSHETAQSLPLAMMLVPISSMVTFVLLMYAKSSSQTVLLIVSIGFLSINFLLFYLYNLLLKSLAQHYENEILKQKVQLYANQLEIIVQSEETRKLFRHDMKHHLNEMKLLAMQGNTAAILEYIGDMEAFMQNPKEVVSSGNTELDSLLNYMLHKARTVLKTVRVKVQIPEAIAHSFDLNIILGNLLENAIEAAEQTEEKILHAAIQLKKGILTIEIENSFPGTKAAPFPTGKMRFFTTKENPKEHGLGLKSVERTVEKYHGAMKIYPRDGLFCVKIILYLPEKESSNTPQRL